MQPEKFQIIYNNSAANVEVHSISGQPIYRVIFSEKIAPLNLTRALHRNADKFWTSIPEGRQELAEKVGTLIEQHIRQKN
jgi:hypothetical protein